MLAVRRREKLPEKIVEKVLTRNQRRKKEAMRPLRRRFCEALPCKVSKMVVDALEIGLGEERTWCAVARVM